MAGKIMMYRTIHSYEVFGGANALGYFGANPVNIAPILLGYGLGSVTHTALSTLNSSTANVKIMLYMHPSVKEGAHYVAFIRQANGTYIVYNDGHGDTPTKTPSQAMIENGGTFLMGWTI